MKNGTANTKMRNVFSVIARGWGMAPQISGLEIAGGSRSRSGDVPRECWHEQQAASDDVRTNELRKHPMSPSEANDLASTRDRSRSRTAVGCKAF